MGIAAALALPAPAHALANPAQTLIERCGHGESLSGFSQSDYAKALKRMSSGTNEYSECEQLIRQAQLEAAGHPRSRGSANGSPTPPPTAIAATPAEQRSVARAQRGDSEPVSLGGQIVHPGVVHADIASAFSTLPAPLLALLGFIVACLLLFGGFLLRRRVRGGNVG